MGTKTAFGILLVLLLCRMSEQTSDQMSAQEQRAWDLHVMVQTLECQLRYAGKNEPNSNSCNATFDNITCWPPSQPGVLVHMPCPAELRGHRYDVTDNVTKLCRSNGTWARIADYGNCHEIIFTKNETENPRRWHLKAAVLLNDIGHSISLVCLSLALMLFLYLKSIRCTRNNIHLNLILTFILKNTTWFIMKSVVTERHTSNDWVCRTVVTLFNYFKVTNFFWMFVEGLYLYIMIAHAYGTEKVKFWIYILIGWCIPIVIVLIWAIVKLFLQNDQCWIAEGGSNYYDFIFHGPTFVILLANCFILGKIVVILVQKLKAHPAGDTGHYSLKAFKAAVVLLPLLGIIYILFFIHPEDTDGTSYLVFIYFNTFLQSFQGFFVSVIYCFTNSEVQNAIKRQFEKWQDSHQFGVPRSASRNLALTVITHTGQSSSVAPDRHDYSKVDIEESTRMSLNDGK
ncbi:corticotropin-releasing factor receptor 2-like isoform X2 [Branchiostoma lanceolatum]|uniref:corticotropin-releasing factor receptor 2-like isoform X2 n=1 Tax=Branchiostoma lanceolatum TaxID=7740 RepID=UPI003452B9FD